MKLLYAGSECGKGESSVCDKAECRDLVVRRVVGGCLSVG
jgi:hypothetical protein